MADLLVQTLAAVLVTKADTAVSSLSSIRTEIGAFQNRLERTQSNLQVAIENTTAAESTIRDADYARESVDFSRAQILTRSSSAMLTQSFANARRVLQLL